MPPADLELAGAKGPVLPIDTGDCEPAAIALRRERAPVAGGLPSQSGLASRSRRILVCSVDHVVDSLEIGGAERLILALATHQKADARRVRIHCLYARGPLAQAAESRGIDVVDYAGEPAWSRVRRLREAFRRFRPAIVHCHNVAATIVAAPLARLVGPARVITTRHGLASAAGAWRREVRFWMAARACDRVVAVCDAAHRELARGPLAMRSRLTTILNGAEPAVLDGTSCWPDVDEFRGRGRLRGAAPSGEGPRHAAHCFCAGAGRGAPAPPLAGGGRPGAPAPREPCRQPRHHPIRLLSRRTAVRGRCACGARIFVLPSLTEGVPLALLEALAHGLLPVVTDAGGMREVIDRAGVGTVVSVGDAAALANAFVGAVSNRARWAAWSALARQSYERHFTIDRLCGDYDSLMDACVSRARAVC